MSEGARSVCFRSWAPFLLLTKTHSGILGLLLFRALGGLVTSRLFALGIGPFLSSHYAPLFESLTASSHITASIVVVMLVVAVIAAVIGSAYGVWQAIKFSPLEAMRHE